MNRADVVFSDLRADHRRNLLKKVEDLLIASGLENRVAKKDLVAVKVHFGELGNTGFIRPVFIRRAVELIKKLGGKPFVVDANTLYAGSRSDSVNHLEVAIGNGFDYSCVGAPLIIADGLRGSSEVEVAIAGEHFKKTSIAAEIFHADAIVALTHFKCHEITGFGGALKNLGMGCASRKGKMAQHSALSPKVTAKKCVACGDCVAHCAHDAIALEEKARINPAKCVGCGECVIVCPTNAVAIQWSEGPRALQEKMAEYALGAIKGKEEKSVFLNFITQVSPACDCCGHTDAPIVPDVGFLSSTDPVAADQASIDLINACVGLPGTAMKANHEAGGDKIRGVYPDIDWSVQLEWAQKLGLGSRSYDLRKI